MPFCRAAVHWQRLAYLLQFSQESPGRCVTPYFPGDFFMLFGSVGNICRFKTGFGCKKNTWCSVLDYSLKIHYN